LKQLRKLRLVSEFVQGPHLHAKNGFVPAVDHPEPNFQAMPDFGNTAKRQECPLNSCNDVFIGKHLGPTLAVVLQFMIVAHVIRASSPLQWRRSQHAGRE
jgi:hypothetical protein